MNAIETRVSERHATHFEISIGRTPNRSPRNFPRICRVGVSRQTKYLRSPFIGRDKMRKKKKKKQIRDRSRKYHSLYCLLCKLFLTFARRSRRRRRWRYIFLGGENCRQSTGDGRRPCEKQTSFFPSGDPHGRKCNQRNGR